MPRNLLLFLSSIFFFTCFLIVSEFLVRAFCPEINFQGIDRHLVKENVFGKTWGWQPDATGICFGKEVVIGQDGFRKLGEEADQDSVLLLIGDSVLFGVGVEAESTFAGLLQHTTLDKSIVNTGVVGYSVREYADVVEGAVPRMPIARAIIFFSLNDFYDGKPRTVHSWEIASFLRRHSKLYLLLKNLLFDRSRTYFEYDAGFYTGRSREVETALGVLVQNAEKLNRLGIPNSVVLIPYEFQLRDENATREPQRMVSEALQEKGIGVVDLLDDFSQRRMNPRSFFLYGDHMHLSALGHRVVAESVANLQP